MLTLIKNADLYAPQPLGKRDVLIADGRIAAIESGISLSGSLPVNTIDAKGAILAPGLVDSLVHITGGGGEGGYSTRTPEMKLTDATLGGVTTVIGALGTDATTRTLPDLLAKTRALEEEGLSAYCYTGSYQYPVRTLTGSVTDDLVLIDKFIGVGEVAIADHRGSHPTADELVRLAAEARVGGMLSGKSGVVSIHVGDGKDKLAVLHQAIGQSEIPASQFYPTHINRNPALFEDGVKYAKAGGTIDLTTSHNAEILASGELPAAEALARALKTGVPGSNITMSSDGNASLPLFDQNGTLTGLEVGQVRSLYQAVVDAVTQFKVPLTQALAAASINPAGILGLSQKGYVAVGKSADLLLIEPDSLQLRHTWAKGQRVIEDGQAVVWGRFE